MTRPGFLLAVALSTCIGTPSATAQQTADSLTEESRERLAALIKPEASEQAWLAVGWQTDLLAARKLAAEQGKPIFLWEMDGHPLGCT
ncbi:MAG: hypothetical protein KA004_14695 [Verrucomicrobiales bacterium]|nr:hypothetical protein [Verrucomicrobiales bacterium]